MEWVEELGLSKDIEIEREVKFLNIFGYEGKEWDRVVDGKWLVEGKFIL